MALVLCLVVAAAASMEPSTSSPGVAADAALSKLPIQVVAGSAPRQTFRGFGWTAVPGSGGTLRGNGATPYHAPMGNFSEDVREHLLTLLCEDLGASVVRVWWTPDDALDGGWHGGDHGRYTGDEQFAAAYVDSGLISDLRRHGIKQLLLAPGGACAPGAKNSTAGGHNITRRAEMTAAFIDKLKRQNNVTIDVTGLANEPGCWHTWQNASGDTIVANWPAVPDRSGNFVGAVTQLSQHLVSRGLHSVKIIGPESSNADSVNLAMVKACGADRACWSALDSIASHSYGMAATESWANATAEAGQPAKGYWVTESGAFGSLDVPAAFPGPHPGKYQGVTMACRFLNDLNHNVGTWLWFIGAWIHDTQMSTFPDGSRQEDQRLIATCPGLASGGDGKPCFGGNTTAQFQIMPTYWFAKQLRDTFDLGAVMRFSTANTTKTNRDGKSVPFVPDMVWTAGVKAPLNVAVGKNPDGSWAVGVANPTGIPVHHKAGTAGGADFPNATELTVELVLEELTIMRGGEAGLGGRAGPISFVAHRSTGDESYIVKEADAVVMRDGKLQVKVGPNELLTLRSAPDTARTVQ